MSEKFTKNTESPIKNEKVALAFTDELWQKIVQNGFGAFNKNDLCDYLLYLFNKHGEGFFDKNSNADNERLFKTTATKIKTSKKNIAVKFMSDTEYQKVFSDFLNDIANDKVVLRPSNTQKGFLTLIIENKVVRDMLADKLKAITQDTLEYNLNTEKVSISIDSFIQMLAKELPQNKQKDLMKDIDKLKDEYKVSSFKDINVKDCVNLVASLITIITPFIQFFAK